MKERAFADAIAAARSSKVAVVFAWSRNRPAFALPGDQDRLIEEVAAVNPNTIVVLNTGQAVAMPWLKEVRAVLEMWYTGDEGGWAAANLLTGKVSPAGRLPFTWPRRLEDMPATDPAHPERSWTSANGTTQYAEGIHIGYRWFDHKQIDPLFPFGFGLSYSRFDYSRLDGAARGGWRARRQLHDPQQRQARLRRSGSSLSGGARSAARRSCFCRACARRLRADHVASRRSEARAAARGAGTAALLVHGRFGVAHRDRRTDGTTLAPLRGTCD